ncbi:MAG TPA: hypothetical protein VMR81_00750 [Patescibacteria group bacterium]|nr:hypothetical protein [Patescibacteria group bacterium]
MNELPGLITASDLSANYYRERMSPLVLGGYLYSPDFYDLRKVLSTSMILKAWVLGRDGLHPDSERYARSQLAEVWTRDVLQCLVQSIPSDHGVPLRAVLTPESLDKNKKSRGADILIAHETDSGYKPFLLFDVTLQMSKKNKNGYHFSPYQEQLSIPVINIRLSRHGLGGSEYHIYEYLEVLRQLIKSGRYSPVHPLNGIRNEQDFWRNFVNLELLPEFRSCSNKIDALQMHDNVRSGLHNKLDEGTQLFAQALDAISVTTAPQQFQLATVGEVYP